MSYLPLLKAVLPFIAPVISATAPIFTRNSSSESPDDKTQAKQIAELQNAVETNGQSVRMLAEQFQKVVEAVDARQLPEPGEIQRLQSQQQQLLQDQSHQTGALQKLVKDVQITKALAAIALVLAAAAVALILVK